MSPEKRMTQAARGALLCTLPMCCRGTACSDTGLSWAAGNLCFIPGAHPAFLLHWSRCLQGCYSHISHSSLPSDVVQQFFPPLNLCSESTPSVARGSTLAAAGGCGSSWSWLWTDIGQCGTAHRGHSRSIPSLNWRGISGTVQNRDRIEWYSKKSDKQRQLGENYWRGQILKKSTVDLEQAPVSV